MNSKFQAKVTDLGLPKEDVEKLKELGIEYVDELVMRCVMAGDPTYHNILSSEGAHIVRSFIIGTVCEMHGQPNWAEEEDPAKQDEIKRKVVDAIREEMGLSTPGQLKGLAGMTMGAVEDPKDELSWGFIMDRRPEEMN